MWVNLQHIYESMRVFATHATLLGTRISRLKACLSRWWFCELRVWWGPWIRETWGYTIQVLWFQFGSTQIFDRWICWDCGVGRLKNELKTTKHPKNMVVNLWSETGTWIFELAICVYPGFIIFMGLCEHEKTPELATGEMFDSHFSFDIFDW